MSSQDNDPDTRQRTVAELIAQQKGGSGRSDVPRGGRRRRAEDGADDTAPQAIIDRVLADSGTMRAVDDSAPPHTTRAQRREPEAQRREPAEVADRQPPPRLRPPRAPRARPPQQEPTQQGVPPVRPPGPGQPPLSQPPGPAQSPPGQPPLSQPPTRMVAPVAPPPEQPTQAGLPPVPEYPKAPPVNEAPPQRGSLSARLSGAESDHTEQFPALPSQAQPGQAKDDAGQPTQFHEAVGNNAVGDSAQETQFHEAVSDGGQETQYHEAVSDGGPETQFHEAVEDDYLDEDYPEHDEDLEDDHLEHDELDEDYEDHPDDLDDQPRRKRGRRARKQKEEPAYEDEYDDYDDEDYEPEPTGAKEWLTLIGLIAAGVIGGAAVWLGFDWLWGRSKLIAAVAAVVLTVLIVFGVRKLWRARDVQTTVFAVIVGLIVTASPAVLLLFSK